MLNVKSLPYFLILIILLASCSLARSEEQPELTQVATLGLLPYPEQNPQGMHPYPDISEGLESTNAFQSQKRLQITPMPNMGILEGILFSSLSNKPVPSTTVFLIEAEGENRNEPPPLLIGPDTKKSELLTTTDHEGYFSLVNIPSGYYFVGVSAPYFLELVSENKNNSSPLLVNIQPNVQDIGVVYVPMP